MRIVNEENHSGRKLALVKDSYGNAIAPFLASSFEEVHVIDFRSFPGICRNIAGKTALRTCCS